MIAIINTIPPPINKGGKQIMISPSQSYIKSFLWPWFPVKLVLSTLVLPFIFLPLTQNFTFLGAKNPLIFYKFL